MIYYKKFKTVNIVANNNSYPPKKIVEKMLFMNLNVHWENASLTIKQSITYFGYTTTKLSRRLTLHLSDSTSICQH